MTPKTISINFKKFVEIKANPNNCVLEKNIEIKATPNKVWKALLEKENYEKWAVAFSEGSTFEGEMKYDSKVYFVDGTRAGLVSLVKVCIPNFQISFEHLGYVKDGVEDYNHPQFLPWKGFRETYTLTEKDGITTLNIYQNLYGSELEFFDEKWDQALKTIKEIAEK